MVTAEPPMEARPSRCRAPGRRRASVLDEAPQTATPQRGAQLPERLRLDLADPLPGHVEALADLLQRVLALFADPEAEPEDLGFLGAQARERPLDLRSQVLGQQRIRGG